MAWCRYLKDRGEVEREYAKALRKLVAKYQVKEGMVIIIIIILIIIIINNNNNFKYQVKEGKREGSTETTQV